MYSTKMRGEDAEPESVTLISSSLLTGPSAYRCMENAILTLINGENPETEKQVNCPPVIVTPENMADEEMQNLLDPTRQAFLK